MPQTMTIFRALVSAMAPYALPKSTIEFLLIQQGLDAEAMYVPGENDKVFYTAVVEGLYKVKTLKKESDPGTENDYDTDKIDDLIDHYRGKYELTDDYSFIDRTAEW